jgi:hypothetical protein
MRNFKLRGLYFAHDPPPPLAPDHDELYFGRTRRLSRHSLENVLPTYVAPRSKLNFPKSVLVQLHMQLQRNVFPVEFGLGVVKLKGDL